VRRLLAPVLIAVAALAIVAVAAVWWQHSRPRVITVSVFTDVTFRQRADWRAVVESRFRELDRIYGAAGVRWKIASMELDRAGYQSAIDVRRAMLARQTNYPADLLLILTGQPERLRTGSVNPFSHAALVVDFRQESEPRNVLFLAYELAHLFGTPHDPKWPESLASAASEKVSLGPRTVKLIRRVRDYNFAAGLNGLEGAWDQRAVDAIAEALTGVFPDPVARAHQVIATALENDRKFTAAISHLRQVVQAGPKSASAHQALAAALSANSQNDAAIAEMREAVRLDPGNPQMHGSLGGLLAMRGNREEADDEFAAAIRLDPANAVWHATLGAVLLRQAGRIDAAIAAFETAVRMDPSLTAVQQTLAKARSLKEKAQAEAARQRTLAQQSPANPDVHYSLGLAEAGAGNLQAAAREFDRVIELNPKHGRAHTGLAMVRYIRQDYAGAWQELRKARALGVEPAPGFLEALKRRMPE
jgi:Flp pilus assembly protein TadD